MTTISHATNMMRICTRFAKTLVKPISPEMAVRLSIAFNTSPESWLAQQLQYDLWHAQQAKQPKVRRFPRADKHKELALA
jgi:addiction module HigA family antidote